MLSLAITSVGYASDISHTTKKAVAEMVLPAGDAAIPTLSNVDEIIPFALVYHDCFEITLTVKYVVLVSEQAQSRPGNYRYLDGINDAFEYGMRY